MKRITVVLLTILLMMNASMVSSANQKLPSAFWGLIDQESALEAAGDVEGLIEKRLEIIALFKTWDFENQQRLEIVTPRYQKIAQAYEKLGRFDEAVPYLELYLENATLLVQKGIWNDDSIKWASSKLKNLEFNIDLYAKTREVDNGTYYGAKFEPISGIYFGSAYDTDPGVGSYNWDRVKKLYPKDNAAYLIYLHWGHDIRDIEVHLKAAVEADNAIQLAWNTYEVISNIESSKAYIEDTARYLNELNVPIFLRYACEMNVGENGKNPDVYVKNFKYVANIMKEIAPNVAMVWSPNDITASDRELESYYPGDAYVDWVGISSYTTFYFGQRTDWGSMQESIDNNYYTGDYANPLAKIKEIVEKYGDRKPIMISETGVAHFSKIAFEDMTDWAKVQMNRLYGYLPIVYPQVKGIYYFNVDTEQATTRSSYALYTNVEIAELYNQLVADPYYLSDIGDEAGYRYAKVGSVKDKSVSAAGESLELVTYSVVPKLLNPKVSYVLDGKTLSTVNTIPYAYSINPDSVAEGNHKLTIAVKNSDGKVLKTRDYLLIKEGNTLKIEATDLRNITFSDIEESWAKDMILEIAKRGIVNGNEGRFEPDSNITRAQIAAIISNFIGDSQVVSESNHFVDVAPDKWYAQPISAASKYLSGYGNYYYPDRDASREEFIKAVILLKGYSASRLTDSEKVVLSSKISDYENVSIDHKDYMLLALKYGIISGYEDGSVKPQNSITRAEASKLIYYTFFK